MGGKGGGGQADPSGMYAAMASAQAAQQEYALGKEQLDWTKQVWAQEQPLIDQAEQMQITAGQADISAQQQAQQFAQEQEGVYNQYFLPMEKQYAGQAANWASPANIALYQGQAQNNVAEQMTNELNTAKEQLQAYGVNPDAPRYAGLYVGQNALSGAAQAGAGTTAAQNLRLQQMGLEQNALNVGSGIGNSSAQLTNAGTSAGQAGASAGSGSAATGQSNLSTGSQAMTAPTAWYNSGAANMGVYTNAVGQYNNSQAQFAQANAQESSGFGALAGGVLGDVIGSKGIMGMFDKGGGVTRYDDGGGVQRYEDGGGVYGYDDGGDIGPDPSQDPMYDAPPTQQAIPPGPVPPMDDTTPGGGVPATASPSRGAITDDVPAQLTAHEFVIPKDVAVWKGHEFFTKAIDQARKSLMQNNSRNDIGGEPVSGIPAQPPRFISRPMHSGSTAAPPLHVQGLSGIPPQHHYQQA